MMPLAPVAVADTPAFPPRVSAGHGMRAALRLVGVPLALLLAACTTTAEGPRDPAPVAACVAQEGALTAAATLESAAGSYRLTLVVPTADDTRRTVTGTLRLEQNEPALRTFGEGVSTPLYGWADIALRAVGALEIGEVGSRDPLSPGVLVLEQRLATGQAPSITLRLGSLANRRTAPGAFDGGYLALHVQHVQPGSFRGRWVSGVHATRVRGHFCATLVSRRG